ncbi:alpha-1,6-glucosidase domain-containing protein [Thalassotalea profundi]|uniref:Pullulanase n=1 Tax=Thalassotalea profundi TaxID=2036687 RepID=A0ABQ3IGL4_9GAMM|nr:alpha-1,6-glucosidase domain-containing protein [Thalassotalea profundi]GHE78025.1 pullulanase [Thalassotalea profundi]
MNTPTTKSTYLTPFYKTLSFSLVLTLSACGGGGSNESSQPTQPQPPENSAPTINQFSVDSTTDLTVNYSWAVTDSNNDALTCVLSPGANLADIAINDCKTTTTQQVTYTAAGDITAQLTVTDTSNATANKALNLTVTDPNQLPSPIVSANDNQLVIFYNRPNNDYDGWILHLWNNAECDAYNQFSADGGTDWATGQAQSGIDPNYGAYWLIELKDNNATCANFIVHKGDEKDIGGLDHKADLTGERMIWTLSGISDLYAEATLYPSGVLIENIAAHWVSPTDLLWNTNTANSNNVNKVRVYSSDTDDMHYDGETGIAGNNYIEFTANNSSEHPATVLAIPRYQSLEAFSVNSVDIAKVKTMLKGKLLAIAYNDNDKVLAATYVQTPQVLDQLYTKTSNDADEATLGLSYSGGNINSALWAPTANNVALKIYDADKNLLSTQALTFDAQTGIWRTAITESNDRLFYRFALTVYHSQNQKFETLEVTDPYSVSLSTNGEYSQFVNLQDDDLKPVDWDTHSIPTITNKEDAIIYEGHIRDFSIRDQSTSAAHRGKYLAFTETNALPVQHLSKLAESGLTHFQMLPANDIASINEDEATRINLNNTVDELCDIAPNTSICAVENGGATILSVYQSYDPSTSNAQALAQELRSLDSFNWGYDPKHFNVPDGSYSTNPDGSARILEMREMNQALHQLGLRVALDVVYNHTSSSGLWDNSVLDKVVPGYYHRRNLITGNVEAETCCQDTAPEHAMMQKLMVDSLVLWATEYKIDAFRFDIMANNSVDSIIAAREAVLAIDSDNYFYGEGWTRQDRGYQQAQQNNMAGTEVGTFNDRPRDTIRSATLFDSNGSLSDQDTIRIGLAGTLANYQLQDKNGTVKSGSNFSQSAYAKDPADIINYVSKHDNQTLWDQLQYGFADEMTLEQRVRAHNIAATLPLLSQGIPFFQLGGDLIRSKSMDRNSYDSGDWFNFVDFTKTTNNWNIGLPLAEDNQDKWTTIADIIALNSTTVTSTDIELASSVFNDFIAIRSASPLFRLTSAQDVIDRVGFHNTGIGQTKGLIVMSLDDGVNDSGPALSDIDENNDAIVVVINGTTQTQSPSIASASGFTLHSIQQNSDDTVVTTASFTENTNNGTFTVPALTTAVFVKVQTGAQDYGLPADVTLNAPDTAPYGNTDLYISASFNDYGNNGYTAADKFTYDGNGIYSLTTTLIAGTQSFIIASQDNTSVNLAYSDVTITSGSVSVSNNNDEFELAVTASGSYTFTLDANSSVPSLAIQNKMPTVDCTALPDSTDNIPFNINGGGELYVRGSHSGWNAEEAYRLHYKGNNIYQAVADFSGELQFKLASDDGSWTTQLWAQAANSNDINDQNLNIGVSYPVAYNDAGESNNLTNLTAGSYSIKLTLNSANPSKGFNVGSLIIQQCQP